METIDTQSLADLCAKLESSILESSSVGFPSIDSIVRSWVAAVARLRKTVTPRFDDWAEAFGLSRVGFETGFEIMLDGASSETAERMAKHAQHSTKPRPEAADQVLKVVALTPSPPLLVVQALLPALVAGSPLLIKVSSREPRLDGRTLTDTLVDCLIEESPVLGATVATVCYPGGTEEVAELEQLLAARAQRFIAYGGQSTIESLKGRFRSSQSKLICHGPKLSLAVIHDSALGDEEQRREILQRLAFDVALFDQRGCLSLHWILTDADSDVLAAELELALTELGWQMPSGPAMEADFPTVQTARSMSALTSTGFVSTGPIERGTVLTKQIPVDFDGSLLEPSPLGRTVRIYQLPTLNAPDSLLDLLQPWRGRLQGMALETGSIDRSLYHQLARDLGVSHLCRAGDLQRVSADWHNGGQDPLVVYGLKES